LPHEKKNSLKEHMLSFRKPTFEEFKVLHDINFEVKKGEFFGIVGRNGSGKSTLLKILGGIYQPTTGQVKVNGTLTPFIELGIGFNAELTGKDNVFLNGAILGLTRKEVMAKYDEIVEFAEMERFMDQKLKNYSSGMQVRLAFSIAIRAHNDILLIDEVLAVGDSNFQKKCFNVFKEIKRSGKTVIFVTHDMGAVQDFCDRAMLISDGDIVMIGKSGKVAKAYNELNLAAVEKADKGGDGKLEKRKGTHAAEITKIFTRLGDKRKRVFRPHEQCEIVVEYKANETVEDPIMGITVKDLTGRPLIVTNTKAKRIKTGTLEAGETFRTVFAIDTVLSDGTYSVSPAIASEDAKIFYDWIEDACEFDVAGWDFPAALVQPEHTIAVNKVQ
jgi:ABC-type polysaccharide/polyol phosphate transport system ATPase subunit